MRIGSAAHGRAAGAEHSIAFGVELPKNYRFTLCLHSGVYKQKHSHALHSILQLVKS